MLGLFAACAVGQVAAGLAEYNHEAARARRGRAHRGRLRRRSGHLWEALFENWESEFLQMSAFVVLSAYLLQVGSPESRRPGAHELADADPRAFRDLPDVPWPVRRGGWVLRVYEYSLGGALFLLFLVSFAGHAVGGWAEQNADLRLHGQAAQSLWAYVDLEPLLVRIAAELAERVPVRRGDGVARGLPPPARLSRVEARPRAACRHRPVTVRLGRSTKECPTGGRPVDSGLRRTTCR